MTRKNEALIAVLIIVALAILLFFLLRGPSEDTATPTGSTEAEDATDVADVDPQDIPPPQEV